jgi:hypothetical protein
VTRFFKIFAIIIIALMIILVSIGIVARQNTYFSQTQIIKSPVSVVWGHLVDVTHYHEWQSEIRMVEFKSGSKIREGIILRFHLSDYDSSYFHEEKIVGLEDNKSIIFLRTGVNENPLLQNYKTNYTLKRLLDGTTELSVDVSYKAVGITSRIYNQLYYRSSLSNSYERNLSSLRDLIEKI